MRTSHRKPSIMDYPFFLERAAEPKAAATRNAFSAARLSITNCPIANLESLYDP
jgi:hypothetical protein